jgi:hypothetical protein
MEVLKMEAKVDIRKLQLLNDRVCQTIDALNQVRMSVHGLGQAQGYAAAPMQFVTGLGHTTGYNPAAAIPAIWPQIAPSFGYAAQQFIPGLGHTTGYAPAILPQFAANAAYNPLLGQAVQQPVWPLLNQGYQNVAAQQWVPGLNHTTGYNQTVPFTPNFAQSFAPNFAQSFAPSFAQIAPSFGYQAAQWANNTGLSHTTADVADYSRMALDNRFNFATAMDPYGVTRLIQTFPFAQYPSSPVL